MIGRRRRAVRRTSDGFVLDLDPDEIHLLRRLTGEVRQLVTGGSPDDPKLARLFPPAYTDDEGSETEYRRLMHDELVASRVAAIDSVETALAHAVADDGSVIGDGRVRLDAAGLEALATSLNSVRLVLGSLLGITDDDAEPDVPEMALYHFLSWLLDGVVEALMTGG